MDEDRGTGRTTEQMKCAPKGSVFIWCNDQLSYPNDLAKKIDRGDLVVVGVSTLNNWSYFAGKLFKGIILDHSARLNKAQDLQLRQTMSHVRD